MMGNMGGTMMGDMMGFGSGGMWFGWIFMLLFWGLVILGIIAIAKWLIGGAGAGRPSRGQSPLQILEARYARGDIEREEFEQKKRDLGG